MRYQNLTLESLPHSHRAADGSIMASSQAACLNRQPAK